MFGFFVKAISWKKTGELIIFVAVTLVSMEFFSPTSAERFHEK